MVVLGQKWLYSGKVVVFRQSGYIWAGVVAFEQNCLYLGKSGCIRAKMVVFGQKWLYSCTFVYAGKVVVVGQKWLYFC